MMDKNVYILSISSYEQKTVKYFTPVTLHKKVRPCAEAHREK